MGAWHFLVLSAGKTPVPINFLVLGGGGRGFFGRGGGSANFIFMGAGIFPKIGVEIWEGDENGRNLFTELAFL